MSRPQLHEAVTRLSDYLHSLRREISGTDNYTLMRGNAELRASDLRVILNAFARGGTETPRTDREVYKISERDVGFEAVGATLCRTIERERGELRKALEAWQRWYDTDSTEAARDGAYYAAKVLLERLS